MMTKLCILLTDIHSEGGNIAKCSNQNMQKVAMFRSSLTRKKSDSLITFFNNMRTDDCNVHYTDDMICIKPSKYLKK